MIGFVWVENAWYSEKGNHEYNYIEELFDDISKKHCVFGDNNYLESCIIKQFDKSLVGMSQQEIYDYMNTLPIVWQPENKS